MAGKKRKKRIRGKFFLFILCVIGVLALAGYLIIRSRETGTIDVGNVDTEMELNGVVIRDESIMITEPFEKIVFQVVEGQTVHNNDMIAQVYRRGYQDETMTTMINLQRDIYNYQMQLLGGRIPSDLADINENIQTVQNQIRASSRGESDLDVLTLEQKLKSLEAERISFLQSTVSADATLSSMYSDLAMQQATQASWMRDIRNEAGTGTVSFYFDGFERALSMNKLGTINAALINNVVRGGNTASTTESTTESSLYRVINNTHWYVAFVTKASDGFRLSEGQQYTLEFPNYSEVLYTGTAIASTTSENSVVNILEFNTDIGKLIGVRTVSCILRKSAQGMTVPNYALSFENGIPGLLIRNGNETLRVNVQVISQDERKAVIEPLNPGDTLVVGQKYIRP